MIFENPEACLVCCELAVVADDLSSGGLGGCEAGSQHVAAGEEFFVCVGVFAARTACPTGSGTRHVPVGRPHPAGQPFISKLGVPAGSHQIQPQRLHQVLPYSR